MGLLFLIFFIGLTSSGNADPFSGKKGDLKYCGMHRVELQDVPITLSEKQERGQILGRVWPPELLQNDDNSFYWWYWMNTQYLASRFQPPYACILEDMFLALYCPAGSTNVASECSVFVWDNSGSNTPGQRMLSGSFTFSESWPPPGYYGWLFMDLSPHHLAFTSDFWVGYKKMQDRPPFGLADNTSSPSHRNMYKNSPTGSWTSWTNGDFAIRAKITKEYPAYWPISGETTMDVLTSAYGPRDISDSTGLQYDFHRGVDIHANYDTVYAVESGKIIYTKPSAQSPSGFGALMVIKHEYEPYNIEYYTYYAHLSDRIFENPGTYINKGEPIAVSGASGGPYVPHLHFGMTSYFYPDDPINPIHFEDSAKHALRILPHINEPANYKIEDLDESYPEVTCSLKVPGDILDCRILECEVVDLISKTRSELIRADYEYIASLGWPTIDDTLQDVDGDGDDDIKFKPQSFLPGNSHQVMHVTFYLENAMPGHGRVYVRAYDDVGDLQKEKYIELTGISEDEGERSFAVGQAYPNPFHREVSIQYQVPTSGNVSIKIYDISGKLIRELVNKTQLPGQYMVRWDGTNGDRARVASGIYFCRIENRTHKETRKMVMIK